MSRSRNRWGDTLGRARRGVVERVTAPNPHRRNEILDAAEARFARQGFSTTSVAELIADTGIAKGTFYHHFASKDEVMHAVIARHVERLATSAETVASRTERPALERLLAILTGGPASAPPAELTAELESDGNERMHALALAETVRAIAPIVARVIADGNATGEFDAADPEATAGTLLAASSQLLDDDVLRWRRDRNVERLTGLIAVTARLLGVPPDALAPIAARLAG